MDQTFYSILHVASVILLTAVTFKAFANPDPRRKGMTMMLHGILALAVVVAGFGLVAKVPYDYDQGWIWVKAACWLIVAGSAGMVYRRPSLAGILQLVVMAAVVVAVWAVYTKPFGPVLE